MLGRTYRGVGDDRWKEIVPNARICIDHGRACSHRCKFCYYFKLDMTSNLPKEDMFKRLEHARMRGDESVEVTGGEPSMYPHMAEVARYAKKLGYKHFRIITNGFSPAKKYEELVDAGVDEWLLSIHGFESSLDKLTCVPKSWENMQRTIATLRKKGARMFANATLQRENYRELPALARYFVDQGFLAVSLINFNPYYEWSGEKNVRLQAKFSDMKPYLKEALEILSEARVFVNIRYFPLCILPEFASMNVNMSQVNFDPYEWTGMNPMPNGDPDYVISDIKKEVPVNDVATRMKNGRALQKNINYNCTPCNECGMRNVCTGPTKQYVESHGTEEFKPFDLVSEHPYHYKNQYETDIVIPCYKMNDGRVTNLLNEIIQKATPPYNIVFAFKEQSAARNRNYLLTRTASPTIIMMDDDIKDLPNGFNRRLALTLWENNQAVAVSARLMNEDGRPGLNSANDFNLVDDLVPAKMIPTACCAFRRVDLVDGNVWFDERFKGSGWEDTWFFECLMKATGRRMFIIDNKCKVVHLNDRREGDGTNWAHNKNLFMHLASEPTTSIRNGGHYHAPMMLGKRDDLVELQEKPMAVNGRLLYTTNMLAFKEEYSKEMRQAGADKELFEKEDEVEVKDE